MLDWTCLGTTFPVHSTLQEKSPCIINKEMRGQGPITKEDGALEVSSERVRSWKNRP